MPIEGITMTTVFSLVAVGIALALSSYLGGYYLRPIFEVDTLMASVAYDIAAIYDIAYTMPGEVTVRYFGPSVCKWNYNQASDSAKSFHCIDARTVLLKDVIVNKEYLLLYNDPYIDYDSAYNDRNPLIRAMGTNYLSDAVSSRKPTHLYIMIPYFNRQVKAQVDIQNEQIFYGSLATAPIAASFTDINILADDKTPSSVAVKNWAFEVTKRRVGTYYYTLAQNPNQPEELLSFINFALRVYKNICKNGQEEDTYYGFNKPDKNITYETLFTEEINIIDDLFNEDYFLRLYRSTRIKAYNSNLDKLYDSWSFDYGLSSDIGKNALVTFPNSLDQVSGVYNKAYLFGKDSYLKSSANNYFTRLGVSMWFKATDLDSTEQVLFSVPSSFQLSITSDNKLKLVKANTLISSSPIRENIWYHVFAIYDSSFLKIYLNGVLLDEIAVNFADFSSTSGFEIGSSSFAGIIDDVKVFDQALSDAEVREIYSTVPGNYLCQEVLTYSKDINSVDKSIYFSHDFGNSTDYSGKEDFQIVEVNTQNVTQGSRSAYWFNGTSLIDVGEVYHFNPEEFSISIWFNSTFNQSNSYTILSKFFDWKGYALYLSPGTTKYLTFLTSKKLGIIGSETYYQAESSEAVSPNAWHHAVIVFNGSYSNLYYDGVLKSSIPSEIQFTESVKFNIGKTVWSDGLNFTGLVDDLRFFERALSASEVSALYADSNSLTNLFLDEVKLNDYQKSYCFDMNTLMDKDCLNVTQIVVSENFIDVINDETIYYATWNSCIKPFIFYDSTTKKMIIDASLSDLNLVTGACRDI